MSAVSNTVTGAAVGGSVGGVPGAIIGAAGGLLSSLVSGLFGSSSQSSAQSFNAQEAQKQREWQEQMYNKYYSPQSQVSQLRSAGLNPYLLANGGSVSSASMPSTSAASSSGIASIDTSGIANAFNQIGMMQYNQQQSSANVDNIKANTRLANAEASIKEADAQTQLEENLMRIDEIISRTNMNKEQKQKFVYDNFITKMTLQNQIDRHALINDAMLADIQQNYANTAFIKVNTAIADTNLKYLPEQLVKQIANYDAQIYAAYAQGNLSYSEAELAAAHKVQSIATTAGIKLSSQDAHKVATAGLIESWYRQRNMKNEYDNTRPYDDPVSRFYMRGFNTIATPLKGLLSVGAAIK